MDKFAETVTFVTSPHVILDYLSKVPAETKNMYSNAQSKIYGENELQPSAVSIIKHAIAQSTDIMLSSINENYLYPDFKKWNICVTQNILFNLPCTIQNVIIIPIHIIVATNDFIITMIHEKIHICQRYNPIWNNIAIDCWLKTNLNPLSYITLKNIANLPIVYNPDTVDCANVYLYKNGQNYYYGFMVLDNGIVRNMWVEVLNNGNVVKCDYPICQYEHPYEMIAYQLSEKIFKDKKMD